MELRAASGSSLVVVPSSLRLCGLFVVIGRGLIVVIGRGVRSFQFVEPGPDGRGVPVRLRCSTYETEPTSIVNHF
jgi:hypothetical protein